MNSGMESTRDKILADIRRALRDGVQQKGSVPAHEGELFRKYDEGLVDGFERAFKAIDGNVVRCNNNEQLVGEIKELIKCKGWKQVASKSAILAQCGGMADLELLCDVDDGEGLQQVEVGITDCEYLVARTGTIVMSTAQPAGRTFPVYTPVHIAIAHERQLVYDLDKAIVKMEERYRADYPSAWYLVSGPSRTGDIEKTLVLGVHGPVEVYVFLVKSIRP